MRKHLLRPFLLHLLVSAALIGGALAQTKGVVVATCGTPPGTYAEGEIRPVTIGTDGKLCAAGASGSTAYTNVTSVPANTLLGRNTTGTGAAEALTAPTLLAATTTAPGIYAGITGDTVARISLGLDTTDTARIGFGPGGASVRDTFIRRSAAATVQFGANDAAAPVAQTATVQSVVAGTSNTAGADWTIAGSKGTGTGAGGKLLLQTAPAGSTGSTQNALVTALSILPTSVIQTAGNIELGAATDTTISRAAAGRVAIEGLGAVRGPASATANNAAIYNSTTGDLIKDSLVNVDASTGTILVNGGVTNTTSLNFFNTTYGIGIDAGTITMYVPTSQPINFKSTSISGTNGARIFPAKEGISLGANIYGNSAAFSMHRGGNSTLTFGPEDAAAPDAQNLSMQSVVAGTSNIAGATFTVTGSIGTGTGAGGAIVFKNAPAGTTGTAQNAVATTFTVQQYGPQLPAAVTVANLPTCGAGTVGVMRPVSDLLAPALFATATGGGAVYGVVVCNATNWVAF